MVIGAEAVWEEAFVRVEPGAFDCVQFGRTGQQQDRCDGLGQDRVAGAVPAGSLDHGQRVRAGAICMLRRSWKVGIASALPTLGGKLARAAPLRVDGHRR